MAARRTSEEARVERPDLEVPIPYSGLCPTPQEPDNFLLDVRARRRLDEQIGERPVAGREQCRTVQALWSRTHRARRRAVRLLPSPNACARVIRKASMAAATTGSSISSIERSELARRGRSSGSSNHSSAPRTARLMATASASEGRLNARVGKSAAPGTPRGVLRARRAPRRPAPRAAQRLRGRPQRARSGLGRPGSLHQAYRALDPLDKCRSSAPASTGPSVPLASGIAWAISAVSRSPDSFPRIVHTCRPESGCKRRSRS